jgi:RNA polymerase sigma-70 factor (ECF subfamily)
MQRLAQTPASGRLPVTDEQRLVSEVLRKDRKATAEFVARCADWVYPYVRAHLMPRADLVEDMMQDIQLAAWQGLSSFRGDAPLQAWLLGIARHKVEDHYRKRLRAIELQESDEPVPEEPALPVFDRQIDLADQQQKVQQTLSRLPEAYGLALLWRYRDNKSIREMAQLTGKTEKAMERLLARARENFRRRWHDVQP